MGEVERDTCPADDLDARLVGLERVETVVAVMRRVEAAVVPEHAAELDELVVRGVHARRVGQTRGEPDRPLGEPVGEHTPHVCELVLGRRPVVEPHRDHAERPVRHEVCRVDRDALVEPIEVGADGAPAPVEPGGVVVPAGELRAKLLEHLVGRGRVRETVLAEHLERDALVDLCLVGRVREQLEVGVRVHVDEPGADDEPAGVDDARRRLAAESADGCDPVAGKADVGLEPGVAGAVEDASALDQDVEHQSSTRPAR